MSIQKTRRESFTAIVNGITGGSTDTSVVVPIATASQPVTGGSAAYIVVTWTAIFSNGHSCCAQTFLSVNGTGPNAVSATVGQLDNPSAADGDDVTVSSGGFNGSGDLELSVANDGSGNRTCDFYAEISTLYVKT